MGLPGTYVSDEPFHLFLDLDEEVCRYNNRHRDDGERFSRAVAGIVGKRVRSVNKPANPTRKNNAFCKALRLQAPD